ncbi:hypothetical protein D1AOALGA4SA_6308 [Olavius algarvensis Delta 1 endosymbiont]|nr:hypothetical protein D1AOALGA4SA_6308 [Olavius algarvensis Delta 1 endosymbiont]
MTFFLVLGIPTGVISADSQPIQDLNAYLLVNAINASALEKLKIISQLFKQRRIKGGANKPLIKALVIEHVDTAGGSSPTSRLKAYEDATRLNGVLSLPFLKSLLIEDVLINNAGYQHGDLETRLGILIDLDEEQGTGTRFWTPRMMMVLSEIMLAETVSLPPERRGMRKLEVLKELRDKGIQSKWIGKIQETEALSEHFLYSKRFADQNPEQTIAFIQNLNTEKFISVFTMTEYEAPFYIQLLLRDRDFNEMTRAEKKAYIEKEEAAGRIHMFTAGNIVRSLNL